MNPNIERLKVIFIAVFALAVVGVVVWQIWWVQPARHCEVELKKWWDPDQRVCATPVLVSDITGRVITDEKALAEAKRALGRPADPPKAAPAAQPDKK